LEKQEKGSIILIQVPYFDSYGVMKKAAGTYFPLGLGFIAAYLQSNNYQVILFDPNVQEVALGDITEFINTNKPIMVGLSFMTPQFSIARDWCDSIRRSCPDLPIVVGGAHPSVLPEETLQGISSADVAVVGEGEETAQDLVDHLVQGSHDFSTVSGIAWRNGGQVRLNPTRPPIEDLDTLPFPDRTLIDQDLYRAQSFLAFSPYTATVYTSRGCPGRCIFCCSGHKLRSGIRERSISNVMKEIGELTSRYRVDYLLIKDDTFTLRKSRVQEFCQQIKVHHPDLKWHCMGRVNTISYEILKEMKDAGLHDIFFGIESGNDEILKKSCKGISTSQARHAVQACADLGIRTYGAFIMGLPGETEETIQETIEFACSLPLTMAGFSIMTPYPGTKAHEEFYSSSDDREDEYGCFVASSGVHYVKGYTGIPAALLEQLPQTVAYAQRRFYLRPGQILRMLRKTNASSIRGYFRGAMALLIKEFYLRSQKQRT
jgi:anaerobic magnesium-protoporphyrin IX monomethyl ester cyclase